ncbi:D-alanyl-D-alanine carboxypeptidase [Novosphingobium sp. 1949]|uniref:serine-type D-Ala-D-Ala carboxypeptidase n=1 Tax=Novosphingobium organovorum TaxID=2930092 RepID=A0ABT0B8K1_9SPHN|nr:D-alanyl-D-alanine carboxypeptidase family protein [Novosphingobium organovorum]MCJ2181401.1 D-alanyl-D-alanine carboxypeptidase [Novosphingobium organovorum]
MVSYRKFMRASAVTLGALVSVSSGGALLAAPAAKTPGAGTVGNPVPPAEVAPVPVSILVDLGSGQVLEQRQPDVPFLPASVTKVMTAFVAFEEIDAGRLSLQRRFRMDKETEKEWWAKGSTMYITSNDNPTTEELLHGIMTASGNDACIVLAKGYAGSVKAWTDKMNAAARSLGMSRSHYNTPNGWMDDGQTYVTASDMVKLADAMIMRHPTLYHEFSGVKTYHWRDVAMRSHDPTVGVVPGADGIKTGYTHEAGYNFVGTAIRDGRRLVMVLAGSSTFKIRDAAAHKLLEWGFADWTPRHLFDKGQTIATAKVQGGVDLSVPLVADREVHATLPASAPGRKVTLSVHYRGPIAAPVTKGERIGDLEIAVEGLSPGHVPLYAAADVGKGGALDRLRNGLITLF